MNIDYFMKIQNAYGTKSRREKELAKINREMSKHFEDTFDTEEVLINGIPTELMIIKDTEGNTFKKKIKTRHEDKFNLGDYVLWNNQVWLITLVDVDDKTWNRGYMYLCTVPLRWQNSEGKIIERFAYSEDFTKYSSGITGNNTIKIGDNQYDLTLPLDSETKKLNRDMRFAIDFDDSDKPDIYILTNRKVGLNNNEYFGRGGTMILTMSFEAFYSNDDKRITMDNGKEVWICNYKDIIPTPLPPSPLNPDKMTVSINAVIQGRKELKCGHPCSYTAVLSDSDNSSIDWNDALYGWNVVSDFDVMQIINGNQIELFVDDEDVISSSFLLQIIRLDNRTVIAKTMISIVDIV